MTGFREALPALGVSAGWECFHDVADLPGDISIRRPFYPRLATKGVSHASLTAGIGVETFTDLLRIPREIAAKLAKCSPRRST